MTDGVRHEIVLPGWQGRNQNAGIWTFVDGKLDAFARLPLDDVLGGELEALGRRPHDPVHAFHPIPDSTHVVFVRSDRRSIGIWDFNPSGS